MSRSNRFLPALATFTALLLAASPCLADGEPAPPGGISSAAQEVIDRAMLAMGGAAAITSVANVSFDCVMENQQGSLSMKVAASKSGGVRIEQSLLPPGTEQPSGRQELITNRTNGWARNLDDGGVRLMPEAVSISVERAGDLWNIVRSGLGQFESVAHEGAAVFSGRPCAKLCFSSPKSQGLQQAFIFFDDETGLPLGQETATSAGMLVSGIARIVEWQLVNGIMVPRRIEVEGQTGSSSLTFSQISFDAVPAETFEVPADVQALLAAAAAGS
ncbi:MAG: hypothetical protein FJ253_10505 [Phycisphaerae bacterium]|nr:hypothetical protein [Phycisphaerae bacterium]